MLQSFPNYMLFAMTREIKWLKNDRASPLSRLHRYLEWCECKRSNHVQWTLFMWCWMSAAIKSFLRRALFRMMKAVYNWFIVLPLCRVICFHEMCDFRRFFFQFNEMKIRRLEVISSPLLTMTNRKQKLVMGRCTVQSSAVSRSDDEASTCGSVFSCQRRYRRKYSSTGT